MAFAVSCKSCNARFLLNDDLLQRKLAGRAVTVRCRQCHSTINVDSEPSNAPNPPPPKRKPEQTIKGVRPAPAAPRPPAKSTLMGIGALPRAAAANELVSLSRGLLGMSDQASTAEFPEPPPAPGPRELFDVGDWDIEGSPPEAQQEPAPESLDDFVQELPPSERPAEEELPSSSGTPSLKALTHLDAVHKPVSDFFDSVGATSTGGLLGAPTIDISDLGAVAAPGEPMGHDLSMPSPTAKTAPSIDVAHLAPPRRGAQTLPLFAFGDPLLGDPQLGDSRDAGAGSAAPAERSSSSVARERLQASPGERPAAPRERRNVVPPTTESQPLQERRRSGLAVPLVLVLAVAAGFLIWKRNTAPRPEPTAKMAENVAPRAEPGLTPKQGATELAANTAPDARAAEALDFGATKAARGSNEVTAAPVHPSRDGGRVGNPIPRDEGVTALGATPKPDLAREPDPELVKDEPKTESAAVLDADPAGPFDKAAASAALGTAVSQASACRKAGDASGVASVIITFAPSGRVTSANVSGPPFAGTPTGGCIAATLRRAKVPPFSGDRVTVSKTVVIQ